MTPKPGGIDIGWRRPLSQYTPLRAARDRQGSWRAACVRPFFG